MNKITEILENYTFGPISLSYGEFGIYQRKIQDQLRKLYTDTVTIDNIVFVAKQNFDNPQRLKSIINYANSNNILCENIVKKFNCNTKEDLFNIIETESKNLFTPDGAYFNEVLRILTKTELYGIQNEEFAAKYLEGFLKQNSIDSKVYRTETDCEDDLLKGIDLYFDYNGKKITCQVKPLKELHNNMRSMFEIVSSGKLKPYSVHYLIFVNYKQNKLIMFKNKIVTYKDKTVFIHLRNFVTKNF